MSELFLTDIIRDMFFESDDESVILEETKLSPASSDGESNNFQLSLLEKIFFREKRNSIKGYLQDIVPKYSKQEFIRHFRVNKDIFKLISKRFEDCEIFKKLEKTHRVKSAEFHVLLFLWYVGHERCGFHEVADRFDTSISTVHAVIKRITYFISSISGEYIIWPSQQKKEKTVNYFLREKGFPGVIGKFYEIWNLLIFYQVFLLRLY